MTIKTWDDPRLPELTDDQRARLSLIRKAQDLYFALLREHATRIPLKHYRVARRTSFSEHHEIEQTAKMHNRLGRLITEQAKAEKELAELGENK